MAINIVLVEPEIPQNTGNIIRTCAVTGAKLHLVKPLGFELTDKHLKRCGLDYWDIADVKIYENFEELEAQNPDAQYVLGTSKVKRTHTDVEYKDGCFLVFGSETKGLSKEIIERHIEDCARIPMLDLERARCLNLSNAVAVMTYEALRQLDYPGMR